jgi:hypothetical protein
VALLVVVGIIRFESRGGSLPMTRGDLARRAEQQAAPPGAPPAPQEGQVSDDASRTRSDESGELRAVAKPAGPAQQGSARGRLGAVSSVKASREVAQGGRVPFASAPAPDAAPPAASAPSDAVRRDALAQRAAKRGPSGEETAAESERRGASPGAASPGATAAPGTAAPSMAPQGTREQAPAPSAVGQLNELKARLPAPLGKTEPTDRAPGIVPQSFAAPPSAKEGFDEKALATTTSTARYAWPRPVRPVATRAERLGRAALARPSASAFDSTAAAWDRVAARAASRSDADLEARVRAANARLVALRLEPTSGRRSAASEAIERVLELAPRGPRREAFERQKDGLE